MYSIEQSDKYNSKPLLLVMNRTILLRRGYRFKSILRPDEFLVNKNFLTTDIYNVVLFKNIHEAEVVQGSDDLFEFVVNNMIEPEKLLWLKKKSESLESNK